MVPNIRQFFLHLLKKVNSSELSLSLHIYSRNELLLDMTFTFLGRIQIGRIGVYSLCSLFNDIKR